MRRTAMGWGVDIPIFVMRRRMSLNGRKPPYPPPPSRPLNRPLFLLRLLPRPHVGVEPAHLQKLFVRPGFRHAPLFQHDDAVGVHHRRPAVRDDQRRPPFGDPRSEEHTSDLQSLMRISYA